jgi:hypothetical protein
MKTAKAVRFWVYWNNSPVKITLRPKSTVSFGKYEDTEEGYSAIEHSYEFDDNGNVIKSITERSCDCDGPFTQWENYRCDREKLKFNNPVWESIDAGQCDAYAAAMGF